ncbi:uncharacterized protein LOC130623170 [Hydractinia symbiolongicarpus]|uniref:uncharacterized protein LOC130623170 n=1 Tax=Hydractinia symbiolongicarpus TaxID=13093 RepID=UPI00254AC7CB|nr:uncharacterized protein LOC130623170 [Hydractinia symbiolongicarpus]
MRSTLVHANEAKKFRWIFGIVATFDEVLDNLTRFNLVLDVAFVIGQTMFPAVCGANALFFAFKTIAHVYDVFGSTSELFTDFEMLLCSVAGKRVDVINKVAARIAFLLTWLNSSSEEQIRRNRVATPSDMPSFKRFGWHELPWRYIRLLVGLQYTDVESFFSFISIRKSRKHMDFPPTSIVNSIPGAKVLMKSRNVRKRFGSPHQRDKQSSQYRPKYLISGNSLSIVARTASSTHLMAMSAYEQELAAPMAVPFVCMRCFPSNVELLCVRQIFSASTRQAVEGDCSALVSRQLRTAFIPKVLSMLGNMFTISNETSMVLSVIVFEFKLSIICKRCWVSLILVAIDSAIGAQCFSTKIARFSMAVLHPVVRRRTGVPALI